MKPEDKVQAPVGAVGGGTETVREQDKIMLVFAYLGLLALIPMLTVKDSEFVKWHAKTGLVIGVGGGVAVTVIGAIPFVGLAVCLLVPALLVLDIMAMMKALKGERWRIPVVSDLADKL